MGVATQDASTAAAARGLFLGRYVGVLQCKSRSCAFRVCGKGLYCCDRCENEDDESHSEDCKRAPLVTKAHGSGENRPDSWSSKLSRLLMEFGPQRLNNIPAVWDDCYGVDNWSKLRPVKQALKAVQSPHSSNTTLIDDWVHHVQDLSLPPANSPAAEDLERDLENDAIMLKNCRSSCRASLQGEMMALARERRISIKFARFTASMWRCQLSCGRKNVDPECPDYQTECSGLGSNAEEAWMTSSMKLLTMFDRWCGSADRRMRMLEDATRCLDELENRIESNVRSSSNGVDQINEAVTGINQMIRNLELHISRLFEDLPPCTSFFWSVYSKIWPHVLSREDENAIGRYVRTAQHSIVASGRSDRYPPLRVWAELAEVAAWSINTKALERLEELSTCSDNPAHDYVRHNLFSLLLEKRAQLEQEMHRRQKSSQVTSVLVRWSSSEPGIWNCAYEAGAVVGAGSTSKGSALYVVPSSSRSGAGVLCEVLDDGRALCRGTQRIDVFLEVARSTNLTVQVLQNYGCVHSRQCNAVLAILETDEQESPFDPVIRSVVVDSWGKQDLKHITTRVSHNYFPPRTSRRAWPNHLPQLTSAQSEAVANGLNRRFSLIRGPPGTGKTHVAAAVAMNFLDFLEDGERVLAVAQSHAAAINLLKRFELFGVNAARVGGRLKPSDIVQQRIFHQVAGSTSKDSESNFAILKRAAEAEEVRSDPTAIATAVGRSTSELLTVQFSVVRRLAFQANVLVMTCAASGNQSVFRGLGKFPFAVLDEAAQMIEPGPLVPLCHGCAGLILVGDEKQLPATVLDRQASKRGLGCSLFERCVKTGIVDFGAGFVQLDEQRRMHPSIAEFPFQQFYSGQVRSASEMATSRPQLPGFPWPSPTCNVCFVDLAGGEGGSRNGTGHSISNEPEAEVLVRCLARFVDDGINPSEIAVITGYSAQQWLLQDLVKRRFRERSDGIRVDTVDGFQGSERELVLVSTVRSNNWGEVGFLRDQRRVNVMLTRAKRGLVVFGNSSTLQNETETWKPWLDWARGRDIVMSAETLADRSRLIAVHNGHHELGR